MSKKDEEKLPPYCIKREGRWYARISYKCKNEDGKEIWRQKERLVTDKDGFPSKTLRDLNRVVRELKNELDANPKAFVNDKSSLTEYLDQWFEITSKSRDRGTNASYKQLIRLYLKPNIGSIQLKELGKMEVQELYNKLSSQGLSSRTVRYVHSVLSTALNDAVEWEKIKFNPAKGRKLPKNDKKEMRPMDKDEVKRFLKECQKSKWGLLLELALATGMRPSEYLGLQWESIKWDESMILVERTVKFIRREEGGGWEPGGLKNKKSRRLIPIDEELVMKLKRHKIAQWQSNKSEKYKNNGFVFATKTGSPIHRNNLKVRGFCHVMKAAQITGVRLYDLRHTYATHHLVVAGTDVKTLSELLGHANASMTLNVYAHVLPSTKKQAAQNFFRELRG